MGTWGTGIEDNDTYLDIKDEFLALYNQGEAIENIYSKFVSDKVFNEISGETHDFWFALADFLWQTKGLNNTVFNLVKNIIETKSNLKYWEETNENYEDIKEREKELNQFLIKISTPKKRAKRRFKKKLYKSLFKKGDIIIFKTNYGHYGISLIIDDEFDNPSESGRNLVVVTDFESIEKPNLNSIDLNKIEVIYILHKYITHTEENPYIGDLSAHSWYLFIEEQFNIDVIGNIEVTSLNFRLNQMAFNWTSLLKYSRKLNNKTENNIRLKLIDFVKKKTSYNTVYK